MDQNSGGKPRRTRRVFTDEFRRSVVEHLLATGKAPSQVAAEFGITSTVLRVWKVRYGPGGPPPDVSTPKTAEELARENQELRKELARVMTQRDILKKTIVIVSERFNRDII
jgi:Transposase and inactivated derivatives